MLIRLGDAIVESDEVVYVRLVDDQGHIEVLFKSHSKVFSRGEKVRIYSDSNDLEGELNEFIKCLAS